MHNARSDHPREASVAVRAASERFPVVLVSGPRQVGKTTLLRRLAAEGTRARAYLTLDDPTLRDLARRDPALFLQRFPAPLLIDEVQYAPELFPHLKLLVDQTPAPGAIWLTGSQQFALMRGVSESLAGRVALVSLSGLSLRERASHRGTTYPVEPFVPAGPALDERLSSARSLPLPALFEEIWLGGFPGLVFGPEPRSGRELFYSSYLQTYLQRDLRDLARVGDESAFLRFLRGTAARTGQLLNLRDLARDADVAPNTAKAWLSILETSGLVYLLQPWHTNASKRLVKAPKLYFLDTGLAAYLTDWSTPGTLAVGAQAGAMLETFVVSEVLKSYWHRGRVAPVWFYRDHEGNEVDLLIVRDGAAHAVEIKKSAAPSAEWTLKMPALAKAKLARGPGAVVCLVERAVPLSAEVLALPVGVL